MNRRGGLLLACGILLTAGGLARAAIGSASEAAVLVAVRGPAGLSIEGVTHELTLAERGGDLLFQVPLAALDTGIRLRNRHMQGYLDVAQFPEAELRVSSRKVVFPTQGRPLESAVQGTLTLHGVARPCSIHYQVEQTRPGEYRIRGTTRIDIRDFQIAVPTWGLGVDPRVGIQVDFSLQGP